MDPLDETTYVPLLVTLLMWIKVLEVCAITLFILTLVTLLVAWQRRLSRRVRASALVPLAAGIATGVAVFALHTTYAYWNWMLEGDYISGGCAAVCPRVPIKRVVVFSETPPQILSGTHTAMVLGWSAIVVTSILLVLGFLGAWRLVATGRHRQVPTSVASEP